MTTTEEVEVEPTVTPHSKKVLGIVVNASLLVLAPLIAILLTLFVFQSYQVDGMSMQNTLQDKDRLIIWKGSRSWARLTGGQYIPNRGDIVVVNEDNLSACGQSGKQIIKRVIGLPGERVVYKDSKYTVYNAEHPHGFDPDTTLPYGKAGTALLEDPAPLNDADVTLGETQLFVSGDHRANSCDSRSIGPVESSQIIGKLVMRILPLSQAERF
ncbi:signal peptidase I [Candidatus Saccharibacteria bacterium]|nr:MAG: signal peptidase I [Candidatus Saccharibacteria bacterium]